jgi:hypothetical protein
MQSDDHELEFSATMLSVAEALDAARRALSKRFTRQQLQPLDAATVELQMFAAGPVSKVAWAEAHEHLVNAGRELRVALRELNTADVKTVEIVHLFDLVQRFRSDAIQCLLPGGPTTKP